MVHYTLTEELQKSGDTALHRARRDDNGAAVLVRSLRGEHPSPRAIARLRHEYAMLRGLALDGVVRAVEVAERGRDVALILEDPGGRPLRARMDEERLPLEATLQIAAGVAEVLDSVHRAHVIHKDIRPENILVDAAAPGIRLFGFGISTRLSQETEQLASPDALEGTLSHLSPEQTGRMNRALDRRTDLYSLGVTLYEMLTGVLPFQASDAMELLHSHLARIPVPPCDLVPEIPVVVSDIAMKLLSKAAEDRYQTAHKLKADLEECLSQWRASSRISPFPLGRHDQGSDLYIPQKLYGRDAELATLLSAWERVRGGTAELVLVSGYTGIGKSVLVHELHREIAKARGYFISGKFDQLNRSVPYASVVRAFQELVHQLLTEHSAALARWKERILAAVGGNGKLLVDVIPDLQLIIGPQPEVPALNATAALNRFTLVFQDFLRVFTAREHPLVIFLDDLQWADLASLALLKLIMTGPERGSLLVIGAYRSTDADAAGPLAKALGEIRESVHVSEVALGPLGRADVGHFVADALGAGPQQTGALSSVVFDKTAGNPFFLIHFLQALYRDGLISWDAGAGAFRWDLEKIRARTATENVAVFMEERLRRLAPEAQETLALAACIGHRFDLRALAVIREAAPADVARSLWDALTQGIVVPLGAEYRFFHGELAPVPPELDVAYRFSHDRVQQAAYSLIGDGQKAALHLRIGQLMLASAGDSPGERLFETVTHMNIGAALIEDREQRRSLARLNLEAGRKAKIAMAYPAAASFLAAGSSLLDETSWDRDYEAAFALHFERAECEALAGSPQEAESLHRTLLARARTDLERARVYDLGIVLYNAQGRTADAIASGMEGLRLAGIKVHATEEEWEAAYEAEHAAVERALSTKRVQDLLNAPELVDLEKRALIELMLHLLPAALGSRPSLYRWLSVKPVSICLSYGNSDAAARAYMAYGMLLSLHLSRHGKAYELAKLALALHDRFSRPEDASQLNFLFVNVAHHAVHWREVLPYLDRAYTAGLETGDLIGISYACTHRIMARIGLGDPLLAVREEIERSLAVIRRTRVASSKTILTIAQRMIACLEGRTPRPTALDGDGFDEAEFAAALERSGFALGLAWYHTVKGELAFLDEDHTAARESLLQAMALQSLNFTPDIYYYEALAILAGRPVQDDGEEARSAPALSRCIEALDRLAGACPENYLHKQLLVKAELARVSGEDLAATDLYDRAIAVAQEHDWARDVALGNELCAKFYLNRGRAKVARTYMTDACYAYAQWGAAAKVRSLAERYPGLVPVEVQSPAYGARGAGRGADQLDVVAFIRALQALAGELVLANVLDRLMRLVMQSSGAQRSFLFLDRDGTLVLEAAALTDLDQVEVGLATPLEASANLAVTVVRYAERLKEPVVLGDASREPRFAGDPYIASRRPRSIACLSMVHQGRAKGVLYIENNAAADAFTKERVDLLGLLLSQAAISVENALLWARVTAVSDELKRSNEALEADVLARTGELKDVAAELRFSNEKLSAELAERLRAEEERAALQAEILRVQSEALAELSTPVIPITRGILVIPLIGAMDEDRALRMLDAAISGAHTRGAKVMILDITGMKLVDARVAQTLTQTATALRLLGAEAVITGVGPDVAQALVDQRVDLGPVVTKAALEDGIAYALAQTGQRWLRAGKRRSR